MVPVYGCIRLSVASAHSSIVVSSLPRFLVDVLIPCDLNHRPLATFVQVCPHQCKGSCHPHRSHFWLISSPLSHLLSLANALIGVRLRAKAFRSLSFFFSYFPSSFQIVVKLLGSGCCILTLSPALSESISLLVTDCISNSSVVSLEWLTVESCIRTWHQQVQLDES